MDTNPIINKVAQKAILTIDLEYYFPKEEELAFIDLKDYLFKGLILREADFRELIKQMDWTVYQDKYVGIHCSADAIVPMWAYMILAAEVTPFAKDVACVDKGLMPEVFFYHNLEKIPVEQYEGQRLIIKGCGDKAIGAAAYTQITAKLAKVARSIMYGEACSNVPVYKKSSP